MAHVEQLEPRRLMSSSWSAETFGSSYAGPADVPGGTRYAPNVLVQSDGHVLVAGTVGGKWALRRYARDGTLDESFGDNGTVNRFRLREARVTLLTPADDGGYFLVGRGFFRDEDRSSRDGRDLIVARLKPDGWLDKSFRPDGAGGERGGFVRVRTNGTFHANDRELLRVVDTARSLASRYEREVDLSFSRYQDGVFGGGSGQFSGGFGRFRPMVTADVLSSSGTASGTSNITGSAQAADRTLLSTGRYALPDGTFSDEEVLALEGIATLYLVRIAPGGAATIAGFTQVDGAKTSGTQGNVLSLVPRRPEQATDGGTPHATGLAASSQPARRGDSAAALSTEAAADILAAQPADLGVGAAGERTPWHHELVVQARADGQTDNIESHASASLRAVTDTEGTALSAAQAAGGATASTAVASRLTRTDAVSAAANRPGFHSASIGPELSDAIGSGVGGATASTLGGDDHLTFSPVLGTAAFGAVRKSRSGDDPGVTTRRPAPVEDVTGTAGDAAPYVTRVLAERIADVTGALAVGRTLGTFAVRVPKPILTTSSLAAAMSRERQRLAPNT